MFSSVAIPASITVGFCLPPPPTSASNRRSAACVDGSDTSPAKTSHPRGKPAPSSDSASVTSGSFRPSFGARNATAPCPGIPGVRIVENRSGKPPPDGTAPPATPAATATAHPSGRASARTRLAPIQIQKLQRRAVLPQPPQRLPLAVRMQHLRHHQRRRDPRIPAPHPLPGPSSASPASFPAHRGVVVLQRIEVHRRHRPLPTPSLRLLRPQAHGAQPAHQILGRRLDPGNIGRARQQHLGHHNHLPPLLLRNRIVHAQVQQGLLADLVADPHRARRRKLLAIHPWCGSWWRGCTWRSGERGWEECWRTAGAESRPKTPLTKETGTTCLLRPRSRSCPPTPGHFRLRCERPPALAPRPASACFRA